MLTMGTGRTICGTQVINLGASLVLCCQIMSMNGQVEQSQPEKGMTTRSSDSSGMNVWIMSEDKPLRPV